MTEDENPLPTTSDKYPADSAKLLSPDDLFTVDLLLTMLGDNNTTDPLPATPDTIPALEPLPTN